MGGVAFCLWGGASLVLLAPVWWKEGLGLDLSRIGSLGLIGLLAPVLVAPLAGYAGERWGERRMLAVAFGLSAVAAACYLVARLWPTPLFAHGISAALRQALFTLAPAAVMATVGSGGETWARFRRVGSVGFLTGSTSAGLLAAHFGLEAPFLAGAVLHLGGAVLLVAAGLRGSDPSPEIQPLLKPESVNSENGPSLRLLLVFGLAAAWIPGAFVFMPLQMRDLGGPYQAVGATYALFGLLALLTLRPVGIMGDRMGVRPLLLIGLVGATLRLGLPALLTVPGSWLLLTLVQLLHVPTWVVLEIATVRSAASARRHGAALGRLHMATSAGAALWAWMGGFLAQQHGVAAAQAFLAVAPLVGLLLLLPLHSSISAGLTRSTSGDRHLQ